MIDKNKDENEDQSHDEYQFVDLDSITPEAGDNENESLSVDSSIVEPWYAKKDNLRYVLIGLGVIIGMLVIYKFMSAIFSSKHAVTQAPVPPPIVKPVVQTPPMPLPQPMPVVENPPNELSKKIAALEIGEGNIRADVSGLNNQISTLSTNVNDLNTKLDALTAAMNTLVAQVTAQSNQIAVLSARPKPIIRRVAKPAITVAPIYYYIQAIIPGRAWLVSTAGATMTVREGTSVPGYGVVKLIDPEQGRVVMSSGRIIVFSQQDT